MLNVNKNLHAMRKNVGISYTQFLGQKFTDQKHIIIR